MSWPNSIARGASVPGPGTFPGVGTPANDNWRGPRVNVKPPMGIPANDNTPPPRIKGRARLPVLPLAGALYLGFVLTGEVIRRIGSAEAWDFEGHAAWESFGGTLQECTTPSIGGTQWLRAGSVVACNPAFGHHSVIESDAVQIVPNQWIPFNRNVRIISVNEINYGIPHPSLDGYFWRKGVWQRTIPGLTSRPLERVRYRPAVAPALIPLPYAAPVPVPHPAFFPPGQVPPNPAPLPVKPGFAVDTGSNGVRSRPRPWPDYLESRRPPRNVHERKFRAHPAVERLIGMATELLDWSTALFNSLPMWRKFQILNAHRQLELREGWGSTNRDARLRYVALTPDQQMEYFIRYRHEVSDAELTKNLLIMLASDAAWGAIGQRMGGYQRGPWDDPFYHNEPNVPDWEHYDPSSDFATVHSHSVLESIYGPLTAKQRDRIVNRMQRWSRHPIYGG